MAHPEQQRFMQSVKDNFPLYFQGSKKVLDVGSADINGNARYLFNGCDNLEYTGCDVAMAPNVDIVSFCHELPFDDNYFDVIFSGECFEHDVFWAASLRKIYQMLKPGGLFFFTCATTGRAEHGTSRTSAGDSYTTSIGIEYYRNLTVDDASIVLSPDNNFKEYKFFTRENPLYDLYFYGIKE
jgi:SAM-dependent methyltransferase